MPRTRLLDVAVPLIALTLLLVALLVTPRAASAEPPITVPTPVPVLKPVPYPPGPPPVVTPAPVQARPATPLRGAPTPLQVDVTPAPGATTAQAEPSPAMEETPSEAPSGVPDAGASAAPEASGSPAASPEVPVTQTEALWMLRIATGRDFPVNTVKGPTAAVIKEYQKSQGLEENGRVDDSTIDKLAAATRDSLHQLGYDGELRVALKAFQKERGLGVDGDLGRQTAAALGQAVEVRKYQEQLQKSGAYGGPVNGKLEPDFKTALEKFQKERGLKVTGTLDDATRKALQGAPSPKPTPSPSPPAVTARVWSPWWYAAGGYVGGVLTMLALMMAARRARR